MFGGRYVSLTFQSLARSLCREKKNEHSTGDPCAHSRAATQIGSHSTSVIQCAKSHRHPRLGKTHSSKNSRSQLLPSTLAATIASFSKVSSSVLSTECFCLCAWRRRVEATHSPIGRSNTKSAACVEMHAKFGKVVTRHRTSAVEKHPSMPSTA